MGFHRPQYETEADREREREVADFMRERFRVRYVQMPQRYPADLLIYNPDGTTRSWIEVKSRNIAFGTYDHLILSLEKVIGLQLLARASGMPAYICANLNDGRFLMPCPAGPVRIDVGGRRDRGDPEDIEPCAVLPWSDFTRME